MANNDQIAEGFNAGYIIEKHQPELAQQLNAAVESVEDEFFQGFVAGSEEYSKERSRAKLLNKLRGDLARPTRSSKDREVDKDGPDMHR